MKITASMAMVVAACCDVIVLSSVMAMTMSMSVLAQRALLEIIQRQSAETSPAGVWRALDVHPHLQITTTACLCR